MSAQPAIQFQTLSPVLQAAWQRFQATLEEGRIKMEQTPRFRDNPQNRAKAYHTLLEAQAMAYNFAVAPRLDYPRVQVNTGWQTYFYTLGQNAMDLHYGVLFLDGSRTYRLTGRMGDIKLFLLQVLTHLSGHPDSKTVGNVDFDNIKKDANGRFEIILSARKHEGNWIPLSGKSDYHFILMRRVLAHWNDDPGDIQIEPVDQLGDHYYDAEEFDEKTVAARIDRATQFARYLIEQFNINLYDMYLKQAGGVKNKMGLLPGVVTSEVGNPASNYAMGIFELEPDEALIVELEQLPRAVYWSFQLGDVWSRSLNFRDYQVDINMTRAAIDKDGRFRAVVAHQDPGVANWLDTRNRREGTIVFRNYKSLDLLVPRVTKVKFADLAQHLPADSRRVTPAERAQALRERRAGFVKLHGE